MSDPLEQFRNIKVPLWARLLGAWRARRHRRAEMKKTVFVCTIRSWVWDTRNQVHIYGWYNLYRDGLGNRWYEYGASPRMEDFWETDHATYGTIVQPWLSGAWDDEGMRKCAEQRERAPRSHNER